MKILIIKLSSLGDVIHTLPSISDAKKQLPALQIDWLVDASFSEIPKFHSGVNQVFSIPLRALKKKLWRLNTWVEITKLILRMRQEKYDLILDAQGLIKSAFLSRLMHGKRMGFDVDSIKEKIAIRFYHETIFVEKKLHAVTRLRILFSKALHYVLPQRDPIFGIRSFFSERLKKSIAKKIIFLHGTTWESKHYPKLYWKQLADFGIQKKYDINMTYGNQSEKTWVLDFQKEMPVTIFKCANLTDIASELVDASCVVGVDTGLTHLSAALGVPTIALYGATSPELTGVIGDHSRVFAAQFPCSPCLKRKCTYLGASQAKPACYETISANQVIPILEEMLSHTRQAK